MAEMKVKKRKEQWFAVKWDGGDTVPEEMLNVFPHVQINDWNGVELEISIYNNKKRQWEEVCIPKGYWAVFSDRRKIKALREDDFRERWEEDV